MAYTLVQCLLSTRLYVTAVALSGAAKSIDRDSLVASADHTRANRDPQNAHDWPVDQHQLVADLWALGLWLQREAADMGTRCPRRPLLDETGNAGAPSSLSRDCLNNGVADLTSDMVKIMSGYQEQKDDLEGPSRVVLVIRALMRLLMLPETDKWTSADVSRTCRSESECKHRKLWT